MIANSNSQRLALISAAHFGTVYSTERTRIYAYLILSQDLTGNFCVPFINPFMPISAFNICCPRDCVSRHNGGNSGAPLKPLRDDSALRALSSLGVLRGAPAVPPLCRETQSLGQQMLNATVGINGLIWPP